jgi:hypothetical protein
MRFDLCAVFSIKTEIFFWENYQFKSCFVRQLSEALKDWHPRLPAGIFGAER